MATHIPLTPPGAASGLLVRPNPPDRAIAADLPPCGPPHKLPADSRRISGEAAISMIVDHVSITVSDMARAAPFYDAIMAALGVPCVWREDDAVGYGFRNGPDDDGRSYMTVRQSTGIVTADNRHWCFSARDRAAVDAFHAAGTSRGGRCDGPPSRAPTITRPTTPPSCWIQTATGSKRCATAADRSARPDGPDGADRLTSRHGMDRPGHSSVSAPPWRECGDRLAADFRLWPSCRPGARRRRSAPAGHLAAGQPAAGHLEGAAGGASRLHDLRAGGGLVCRPAGRRSAAGGIDGGAGASRRGPAGAGTAPAHL